MQMGAMIMSENDKKKKDPKKPTEEEMLEFLDKLKNKNKNKEIPLSLGFLLHKNYLTHIIISFIINFLLAAVIIGLTSGIKQPLITITIAGFLFGFVLLTVIENFVKLLLFKYVLRAMVLSIGLLSVSVQIIILYSIDLLLGDGFKFNGVEHLFVFAFAFSIFRVLIASRIRQRIYDEKLVVFRRKKK